MGRGLVIVLLLIIGLGPAARGEEVVADLSQTQVSITTNFAGSKILLFGAVRREMPIPDGPPLHVVVTVAGPAQPLVIRRKSRTVGIWTNTASSEIDAAPSFYAVATSGPFRDVMSNTENLRHHVTIDRAIRAVDGVSAPDDTITAYVDALIRIREREGQYRMDEGSVDLQRQTLFRTEIALPANLTEGSYTTRIFLTRDGAVIDRFETVIDVRKVGLERWINGLAHDRPLIYGLLSLAIAIVAGWAASAFFRNLLRG